MKETFYLLMICFLGITGMLSTVLLHPLLIQNNNLGFLVILLKVLFLMLILTPLIYPRMQSFRIND